MSADKIDRHGRRGSTDWNDVDRSLYASLTGLSELSLIARQVYVDEGKRFHQTLIREATRGLDGSFYANYTDYHRRKVQEHSKTSDSLKSFFRTLDNFLQ